MGAFLTDLQLCDGEALSARPQAHMVNQGLYLDLASPRVVRQHYNHITPSVNTHTHSRACTHTHTHSHTLTHTHTSLLSLV